MKHEHAKLIEEANGMDIMTQVMAMDADKQEAFKIVVLSVLRVMHSADGCIVMALDADGEGNAMISVLGNAMIAPQLARVMTDILEQMDEPAGGVH